MKTNSASSINTEEAGRFNSSAETRALTTSAKKQYAAKYSLLQNCVSREQYDAVAAKRDMYMKPHGHDGEELDCLRTHEAELSKCIEGLERTNAKIIAYSNVSDVYGNSSHSLAVVDYGL